MAKARRAKRRTYHHGDLERALVDAGIVLIGQKGATSFTMREVATRVGVSHAAAYRHFADKKALLDAIAAQGYSDLGQRLRAAIVRVPRAKTERRLTCLGAAYVSFAIENEPRFAVMTRPRSEENASPELDAAIDAALGVVVAVAREGVERGELTAGPPMDHAMRAYVFAFGYASLVLRGRVRVRPERLEAYFAALFAPVVTAMRGD